MEQIDTGKFTKEEQRLVLKKLNAYLRDSNPPRVYTIKEFLCFANKEFEKYEDYIRKELGFKKYTFKMLIKDLEQLKFIEDISEDWPGPVYIVNSNDKENASPFFLERCFNSRKMHDYQFKIYSENAQWLLVLIERLHRDLPFHIFRHEDCMYYCDLVKWSTNNPSGSPQIKEYNMEEFIEKNKNNFKHIWEL